MHTVAIRVCESVRVHRTLIMRAAVYVEGENKMSSNNLWQVKTRNVQVQVDARMSSVESSSHQRSTVLNMHTNDSFLFLGRRIRCWRNRNIHNNK